MATQTGSYDFKATKEAHDDAEKKATNYIYEHTDNATYFHAEDDNWTTSGDSVRISDKVEILRNGDSVIAVGETDESAVDIIRIGKSGEANVAIDEDSLDIRDGSKTLAMFGASAAQIGADDAPRAIFGSSEMSMVTAEGSAYFSVDMDGGGSETIDNVYTIASNKSATNNKSSDHTMILVQFGNFAPLNALSIGDSFTIKMKLGHWHKLSASGSWERTMTRTLEHTFTRQNSVTDWSADRYEIHSNPDYYKYDVRIYMSADVTNCNLAVWNFSRTTNSFDNVYSYRVTLDEATFTSGATQNVPLIEMTGKTCLNLFVDKNASKTSAAVSGSDKDLFNAIRTLGWYDDVIV